MTLRLSLLFLAGSFVCSASWVEEMSGTAFTSREKTAGIEAGPEFGAMGAAGVALVAIGVVGKKRKSDD